MNPFVTISLLVLVLPSYLFLLVLGSHLNIKDLPGYEKCLSSSGLEEKDLETANNSKEMKCFDKCLLVEQGDTICEK
ncbi:unnamed protein product [Acanthoscelides obtectus]|uniref:Uncharacterized protein n=1 Tax=Acanthoscelides obtectus TaxID=200917 RepID=A0A9P0KP37_ACAOB|nr:unnamed protein product [Acanthoscelides obtectus]CAK1664452.1 hypothetical protein AOBTE_LOCUS24266 [Acanthoscelides obtectus]